VIQIKILKESKKLKVMMVRFFSRKKLGMGLAVILTVVFFLLVKYEIVEDCIPKRLGVVEQGYIYRSGQLDEELIKKTLVKYKIGLIISLSKEALDDVDVRTEINTAEELGIKRLVFPLSGDGTGDINNYADAVAAIYEARKENTPVIVHCSAGSQRTGGVIAVYQLLVEKKESSIVFSEMEHYGANIRGNSPLLWYLNIHMKELAVLLKQKGVIDDVPATVPRLGPFNVISTFDMNKYK
jgi:protein-tyrosine phosphatase